MSYKRISWKEAEKLVNKRVDRRRTYYTTEDNKPDEYGEILFDYGYYYDSCSGCTDSIDGYLIHDYPLHKKHNCPIGAGCHECGYHGITKIILITPWYGSKTFRNIN